MNAKKVPISLMIDDSAPAVPVYYTQCRMEWMSFEEIMHYTIELHKNGE